MDETIRDATTTRLLAHYDRAAAEANDLRHWLAANGLDVSEKLGPDDWPVLPGMTEVLLRVERHDGNDPIEQSIRLPFVPRVGDMLEFWDNESGFINSPTERHPAPNYSGEPVYGEVEEVVQAVYAPERIEVWLTFEGFDLEQIERVIEKAQRDDQP